jgi:hypothetical protein
MILFVDPNVHGCGVALFHDGDLLRARYVKHPGHLGRRYLSATLLGQEVLRQVLDMLNLNKRVKLDLLVVEHPVIYPGMPSKDLNDLIDVATVGAAVNSALYLNANAYQTVFPAEWKGNVPKKTMLERIKSRLTPEELKRCEFTNKSDNEDLLDAVGMGLWHSGRLNKRSYPGAT